MKFNFWPFKKKSIIANCGHETKIKDKISAFGETIIIKITPIKKGEIEYCHKCLEKMVIKCAWCGKPIFIGDFITLYCPTDKNFVLPEGSVIYKKEPLTLVGCERSNCADTGGDYCGVWVPPGKVHRMMSAIEMVMASGRPVISNTSNGKIDSIILKN